MLLKNTIFVLFLSVVIVSCNKNNVSIAPKDKNVINCTTEIRGGFDIGSGSTKLQIASVKVCENKEITIQKSYFKENANVQYSAALIQDPHDPSKVILPDTIIADGYKVMAHLRDKALEKLAKDCGSSCFVSSWRGIMTAAFRKANNWQSAQNQLSKVVDGLIIKRLAQDEEALYGFYPVIKIKGIDLSNAVVWDMGGGSTQITAFSPDFKISADFTATGAKVIEMPVGSGTFENELKGSATTFNPIDTKINIATQYIKNNLEKDLAAKQEIKNDFSNLFVNGKKYYVIGGILSRALPAIVKVTLKDFNLLSYAKIKDSAMINVISLADISKNFNQVKTYSDAELKNYALDNKIMSKAELDDPKNASRYKSISSNLLLTKTYMESDLSISDIYPVIIDGTDTLMISPKFSDEEYWKTDKLSAK